MISNKHMYVQFIDDDKAVTLASASTVTLGGDGKNNRATAKLLGKHVGEIALGKGIRDVVVDRGGYKFHGRLKAITDAIREVGISTGTMKEPEATKEHETSKAPEEAKAPEKVKEQDKGREPKKAKEPAKTREPVKMKETK